MAEVYANLIRRGRKTIEQVPERLREQVSALIRKQVEEILKDLEVEVE